MRNVLGRHWRLLAGAGALLLAIGALLAWGPIGLGNGPLFIGEDAGQGWSDTARLPVGMIVPVFNSGHQPTVIDSVRLIDRTRYPAPQVFALRMVTGIACGGEWPVRRGPHGPLPAICRARDLGPLTGHLVPFSPPFRPRFAAVAESAPPRPDSCWAVTAVVVHYHVGIRHYTATDPYPTVACTGRAATDAKMQQVMDAAGRAAPG